MAAIGIAVWLHARVTLTHAPAGKVFERGLQGILTVLHPQQPVIYATPGLPSEAEMYLRLAVAPRHAAPYDPAIPADTVLVVKSISAADTFSARRLVWQAREGDLEFKLLALQ
jgi:hypothetical protein